MLAPDGGIEKGHPGCSEGTPCNAPHTVAGMLAFI